MERVIYKCKWCGYILKKGYNECFRCRSERKFSQKLPDSVLPDSVPKILVKNILTSSTCTFVNPDPKEENRSFFIHGKSGIGKSLQAAILMYRILRRTNKYQGIWINVPEMLFNIRQSFNKSSESNIEKEIYDSCVNIPWLCLDDLGVEKMSDFAFQTLYLIINKRYEEEKTTVITSNLSIDELYNKFEDDRILSRISGMCKEIQLGGDDKRNGTDRRRRRQNIPLNQK